MADTQSQQTLPPFRPEVFHRRLAATIALQWLIWSLIILGWTLSLIPHLSETYWPDGFMLAGLAAWFIANFASTQPSRLAMQVSQLSSVEAPTHRIEHLLAQAMPRFTLFRNMRYLLTQQLAVLRHRQHRYDESAMIASTMLDQLPSSPRGRYAPIRAKLLILLADAAMFQQHLPVAYTALADLQRYTLDTMQTMQVMEIQTRYQLACGQARQALIRLPQKLQLVDLMPPPHAVQMHQLFALAAESDARPRTADYLRRRAELLNPTPVSTSAPGS